MYAYFSKLFLLLPCILFHFKIILRLHLVRLKYSLLGVHCLCYIMYFIQWHFLDTLCKLNSQVWVVFMIACRWIFPLPYLMSMSCLWIGYLKLVVRVVTPDIVFYGFISGIIVWWLSLNGNIFLLYSSKVYIFVYLTNVVSGLWPVPWWNMFNLFPDSEYFNMCYFIFGCFIQI